MGVYAAPLGTPLPGILMPGEDWEPIGEISREVIESESVPRGMTLYLDSRSITPKRPPSNDPPMWAVQPQRSKRDRKSSRRVK